MPINLPNPISLHSQPLSRNRQDGNKISTNNVGRIPKKQSVYEGNIRHFAGTM